MNDFIPEFWGYYIAAIALVDIAWCTWLLFSQRCTQVAPEHSAGEDTDRVWDGDLHELNNPLPRWRMRMFLLSYTLALGHLILYLGLGAYGGVLDFSTCGELASQRTAADAQVHPLYERYTGMDIKQIVTDPQAHEIGQHPFLNSCARYHGSDASGSKDFPNLTGNGWLYDGEPGMILTSIAKGRHGVMSLLAVVMDGNQAVNTANYVRSLLGLAYNPIKAACGEPTFKSVCTARHMATGKSDQALDIPDLTGHVWSCGSSEAAIVETILKGCDNTMPTHESLFSPEKTRMLTTYVRGLSNNDTSHA